MPAMFALCQNSIIALISNVIVITIISIAIIGMGKNRKLGEMQDFLARVGEV